MWTFNTIYYNTFNTYIITYCLYFLIIVILF